jgi:hypothetical protein
VGIYLSTHEWFDIQQVLVVHGALRSGYLFIYTWMVWYTSFSDTFSFKGVVIYLFTQERFDIQQVLVVNIALRSWYLFIYTGMVWYTTSFSGTCCLKEWVM